MLSGPEGTNALLCMAAALGCLCLSAGFRRDERAEFAPSVGRGCCLLGEGSMLDAEERGACLQQFVVLPGW